MVALVAPPGCWKGDCLALSPSGVSFVFAHPRLAAPHTTLLLPSSAHLPAAPVALCCAAETLPAAVGRWRELGVALLLELLGGMQAVVSASDRPHAQRLFAQAQAFLQVCNVLNGEYEQVSRLAGWQLSNTLAGCRPSCPGWTFPERTCQVAAWHVPNYLMWATLPVLLATGCILHCCCTGTGLIQLPTPCLLSLPSCASLLQEYAAALCCCVLDTLTLLVAGSVANRRALA